VNWKNQKRKKSGDNEHFKHSYTLVVLVACANLTTKEPRHEENFAPLQCYIEESRIADNKFPPWVLHFLFANG
jgi:hypothetical protein